jgi:hypothetical protein
MTKKCPRYKQIKFCCLSPTFLWLAKDFLLWISPLIWQKYLIMKIKYTVIFTLQNWIKVGATIGYSSRTTHVPRCLQRTGPATPPANAPRKASIISHEHFRYNFRESAWFWTLFVKNLYRRMVLFICVNIDISLHVFCIGGQALGSCASSFGVCCVCKFGKFTL